MAHSNSASIAPPSEGIEAYRSVSTLAVLSFVLGLLSLLSFAPSRVFMFMFPPAALVTGLLAVRQVTLAPEVWTGKRLAKLGIGFASVCFAGSAAVKYLESTRIEKHGRIIADRFVDKLKAGDTEGAFWLKFPRETRAAYLDKTADDIPGQIVQQYGMFYSDAAYLAKAISSGEATVEFEMVEFTTTEQNEENAVVVYEYRTATEDTHLMVLATSYAVPDSHERSWFIREHRARYTPQSYARSQSMGHGHSH